MSQTIIQQRLRIEVNTDPQCRCYDGRHACSELRWTQWGYLETVTKEGLKQRLEFWKELNKYSVSQRGESVLREFKAVPKEST